VNDDGSAKGDGVPSELQLDEQSFPAAKVLLVDDIRANLLAITAVLEPLGHEIVEAMSGAQALALAEREEFAVILLDVMMPEMDGFEVLERLHRVPLVRHTPVILQTAYDLDLEAIERAYALGAVDYVRKPAPPSLLRGKVAALTSLYRRGQELRRRGAVLAAKDRQLAMLAHDLRNPLTVVTTAGALLRRGSEDPRVRTLAERVSRAGQRMDDMVRDLLDYARVGAGTIPIAPAPVDMRDLCRELVEDFELASPVPTIEVTNAGDTRGEWDRARILQALANLLGNAAKYGGGRAAIHVQRTGKEIEVAVHNDGPAIPRDVLPKIFEPFERGQQDGTGLGLGLYIVREIAHAHRGEVAVASSSEAGTTFTLRLPVTPLRAV
jgi:two-component system sensor histidine kinase/response regulator